MFAASILGYRLSMWIVKDLHFRRKKTEKKNAGTQAPEEGSPKNVGMQNPAPQIPLENLVQEQIILVYQVDTWMSDYLEQSWGISTP